MLVRSIGAHLTICAILDARTSSNNVREVDISILVSLSIIAAQQNSPTEKTEKAVTQLMDYLAKHPDATIRYHASDMILKIHSDASYLTEPKARSRIGGHFFLGKETEKGKPIYLNGAIHTLCAILKHVVASAAESELGALFIRHVDISMPK